MIGSKRWNVLTPMETGITTNRIQNNPVTAMQRLVNYKKVCSFLRFRFVSLQASLEAEHKKPFFRQNHWRFSRKAKGLIVFAIITVMLVSIFAILPKLNNSTRDMSQSNDDSTASPSASPSATNNQTGSDTLSQIAHFMSSVVVSVTQDVSQPKGLGTIGAAQTINSTVWLAVASNAWRYFQPGTGVDSNTGLPYSSPAAPGFTDWDLGVYIQAVIDAQKIGLIGTDGSWNASDRLNRVLTFLETRPLNDTTHYPYWFYQTADGQDDNADSDLATGSVDVVDTGRLFVALNNLKAYNSSLASRIDNIVYNVNGNRSDYAALVPGIKSGSLTSTSIYAYYFVSGFASFWPDSLVDVPSTILNNIFSAGNVTTYGDVSLPKAAITCDPLLCSVFELNNNDSRLMALASQVYLAHEAYYNSTRQYRAFSEGPSLKTQWVYEWVVLPDNRTWVVLDENNQDLNMTAIIYTKVAMGFLAIYNTTFAKNMCVYLENTLPDPMQGYYEGVEEYGQNYLNWVGCNTNGLILDAALYATQNNP